MEKLTAFLDEYYKTYETSGSLCVTSKGKIVYKKYLGYADRENKISFADESRFTLYSLSKPFCAIGIMKLWDKGLVDIDKHPGEYVKEAGIFHKNVTIRHLLSHTSGIVDFDQTTDFRKRFKGETSKQICDKLPLLAEYDMYFEPGQGERYTNINFIIPALIIEAVSGISYAEYMEKEVFDPLGMKNTFVDRKNLYIENRVKGYNKEGEKIIYTDRVDEWILGGADIVSTVSDVYKLNIAIKNKLILTPKAWDEVLKPSPLNDMGFGCRITDWHGKKRITHNGGWEGFRTLHIQLPEDDFDIIFLSNAGWGDARRDISEAVYKAFYGDDKLTSDEVKMDVGYI